MSVKAVSWAFQIKGLKPTQKLILLAFADFSDDNGLCFPSYQTIADKAEVSRRTAMRAATEFKKLGLIKKVEKRSSNKGDSESNRFHFDLTKTELDKVTEEKGGSDTKSPPSVTGDTTLVTKPCHHRSDTAMSPKPSLEPSSEPSLNISSSEADASTPEKPKHPGAVVETPKGEKWGYQIDLDMAQTIFETLSAVTEIKKPSSWADWANTIRLMREIDNRELNHIKVLFEWAVRDPFWSTNILSPQSLRKHWAKLAQQRKQERANAGGLNHANSSAGNHPERLSTAERNSQAAEQFIQDLQSQPGDEGSGCEVMAANG